MTSAINWNLYTTRININGDTVRDRNIYELKNLIVNDVDSPSNILVTKNGVYGNLIIFDTDKDYIKEINSIPDETFNLGDLIVYNNKNWLITECGFNAIDQSTGKMTQCNYNLKFQDASGQIVTLPAIFEPKSTSVDENKMLDTLSQTGTIKVQFDSVYADILVTNKRFMIDSRLPYVAVPNVYKIIDVNLQSYDGSTGLVTITVIKDEFNIDKDNKTYGVCDYFIIDSSSGSTGTSITFEGNAEIRCGGAYKEFVAVFPSNDSTPMWSVSIDDGYSSYVDYYTEGNTITIGVLSGSNSIIGKTITLSLTESSGQNYSNLDIEVISL
jgi:hypothetical protein